jgi:murein DD-endopeptidase MepM/ murein hydrolase activator NlpD
LIRAAAAVAVLLLAGCSAPQRPLPAAATPRPPAATAPVRIIDTTIALSGAVAQGGLITGFAPAGTVALRLDGAALRLGADRRFVAGFGRDAAGLATLDAVQRDGSVQRMVLRVMPREWKIERLPSLGSNGPPNPAYDRLRETETAQLKAGKSVISAQAGWRDRFIWPAGGRISGVYGSQRILGGVPRNPHYGVDIAAPAGTRFVAPAAGIVTLARGPFSLEGNVLMIDHGNGLVSAFLHLSRFDVTEGQQVTQGQPVGAIGTTGRSTGPHLHWGLTLLLAAGEVRIDPELLVPAKVAGRTP